MQQQAEVLCFSLEKGNMVPQIKHNPWSLKCHQQHLQRMKENAKHRNQYSILLLLGMQSRGPDWPDLTVLISACILHVLLSLLSLTPFHRIYPFGEPDVALHSPMCLRLEDGNSPTWRWCIRGEESQSNSQMSTEHISIHWGATLWHAGRVRIMQHSYSALMFLDTDSFLFLIFLTCRSTSQTWASWYSWISTMAVSWLLRASKRLSTSSSTMGVACAVSCCHQCCGDSEKCRLPWRPASPIASTPAPCSSYTMAIPPGIPVDPDTVVGKTGMRMSHPMKRKKKMRGKRRGPLAALVPPQLVAQERAAAPMWMCAWSTLLTPRADTMERTAWCMKVRTVVSSLASRTWSPSSPSWRITALTEAAPESVWSKFEAWQELAEL